MNTRAAAVAGTFYPAKPAHLQAELAQLLGEPGASERAPKVIVAPHAGYAYSGTTAATAYAALAGHHEQISRVVLLGPSHHVAFKGIALSSARAYETPLGSIPLWGADDQDLSRLDGVGILDEAHRLEHSLEVQLPFLQQMLGSFTLLPLVVGDADAAQVAAVINHLWGGAETLIVISTDLSHFLDYASAQQRDNATVAKILALDDSLSSADACGCKPLNGLLRHLRNRGLKLQSTACRNSGDTKGDRDRVVGYASFTCHDVVMTALPLAHRQQLLHIARQAIHARLAGRSLHLDAADFAAAFREPGASFVTLHHQDKLRGCIGSLTPRRSLLEDVASNAQAAAFNDPRFSALTRDEFSAVEIHISLLGKPQTMQVNSFADLVGQLAPGKDGLIIRSRHHQATFLPSVWEQLLAPATFVNQLLRKAGLPEHTLPGDVIVQRYHTEEFS